MYNPPHFPFPALPPLLPSSFFNLELWMGRSVSDLASLSFSHGFALKLFGCETNLPTIGLLPLSVQFNRCWHVGGYPWVCKICFPCFWHPIEDTHCVCIWVWKSSSVWSCACTALLCSFFALIHWVLFLKCLHYMNLKEMLKKKTQNPCPIRSVFVYTRVRTIILK